MRITGGEFRGRILQVPKGDAVRPTSDRTRQAMFNIITAGRWRLDGDGFTLDDAHVIDVFCGTGALGLEALSRGAASGVFIDKDKTSLAFAKQNAEMLKVGNQASFFLKEASKIGMKPVALHAASLIFLDPPYRKQLVAPALMALIEGGWMAPSAIVVIETEKDVAADDLAVLPFVCLDARSYGDTLVRILKYIPV